MRWSLWTSTRIDSSTSSILGSSESGPRRRKGELWTNDDWASWYADWLINLSELPQILGKKPLRSELVYLLVKLDKDYTAEKPDERWEDYYARAVVDHFAS
jgi:hypothetical protein